MEIQWMPNPLATRVILDERDRAILRQAIKIELLETRIYEALFKLSPKHLKPGETPDILGALKALDTDGMEREPMESAIDQRSEWMLESLHEEHLGDCVCQPCSCSKCHTESMLGIDTIEGLGKHAACYISGAFGDGRTIDQAIDILDAYDPKPDGTWKDGWLAKWKTDHQAAAEWLRAYRDKHFPQEAAPTKQPPDV